MEFVSWRSHIITGSSPINGCSSKPFYVENKFYLKIGHENNVNFSSKFLPLN
jgi:hypothetical protein